MEETTSYSSVREVIAWTLAAVGLQKETGKG